MSWRDRLRPASFRGVPFLVDGTETEQELFVDEQLFPGRDRAADAVHVEPLGAGPTRFRVDAFVIGPDFDVARDALERALLQPGSGRLVHPSRGERTVAVVGRITTSETRRRGGVARIRFSAVETAEPEPRVEEVEDLAGPRAAAAEALVGAVDVEALEEAPSAVRGGALATFDAALRQGQAAYATLVSELGVLQTVASRADALTGLAADFVQAPADALGDFVETVASLYQAAAAVTTAPGRAVEGALGALEGYLALLDEEEASRPPRRALERDLRAQLADLARGAWIVSTAELASVATFESRQQALAARARLLGIIDTFLAQSHASGTSVAGAAVYGRFADVRGALSARLDAAAATLPELRSYTLRADLPALVVAHLLYGDARREEEVLTRNPTRHPELLEAGTVLEVLREGR